MSNTEIQPGDASPAPVTEAQGDRDQTANRQFRLRNSCDRCQDTKLKCSQAKPACRRCVRLGLPCVYSPIRRLGRPRKHSSSQLEDSTQQQQQQQPPPPSSALPSWGGAGASGGGQGENHDSEVPNIGQSRGGPSTSTSLQKILTPAFHETVSPFTDAFLDAMSGVNDNGGSTIVIPSALHQPVIDSNHQFDVVMETLFTTDPTTSESLSAAVSLNETTFEDLQNWATERSHYNTPVDQHEQFGTEALSGTTDRSSSSTMNLSESGAAAAVAAVSDVFSPDRSSAHFHTQPLAISTSSLTSSSLLCSNDCYRCLSQQLAGLNSFTNYSVAPNVDIILQIDRNMQELTQSLLNCPHCLANDSSLLLLSIIMDQATRLLDCFIEKVKPDVAIMDHQSSSRGSSGGPNKNNAGDGNSGVTYQNSYRSQPSASGVGLGKLYIPPAVPAAPPLHRKQSLIHTTELRIGEYEVLDEDLKLTFLKRLVRHRLRIFVGMLTDLQNTTGGHMKEMQCSATLGMLRGVMERVERLRGKMSIKW
ncbi:hypothetical protein BDP81DRAFT_393793 [Colletotrichum phormii]|uniref:Zn(2)-C6 fungal-type domain-containing protein n=1 Tax=Colletotrichum phormii TaxID=359342 RepID=A0AAI9ZUB5_9PEZI|nr:uncharacterized protein BDP81DRAFT_393793 [Colletotrichum phormii]KAK1637098.1 hypothetical protein BDP81DRAFT_393793 [Colletotrichum phormii]